MRAGLVAVFAGLCLTDVASAQGGACRFQWQAEQVLSYRVEHNTTVTEVIDGKKVTTSAKLNLVKRWQILNVDPNGVATLQLSLAAMRNEQTRPDGEVLLFDSADLEKSTPGLKEQLSKYVNQPLATVRVDTLGKVIEVLKGQGKRYEAEPPFVITLPGAPVAAGHTWERNYQIVLEPPQGTGEKYDATQKFECKKSDGPTGVFEITTLVKNMPKESLDQVPLLQKQVQGEVEFDLNAGRMRSARLSIDRVIENHQGSGSSYHFQSTYSERFVEDNR